MRNLLAAVVGLSVIALGGNAFASPWTLPKDDLSLTLGFDFQQATEEYQTDGARREFPLDGTFTSQTLGLGLRYGFTDRLELELDVQLKSVAYKAEPVVLRFAPGVETVDLQGARDAVYDFSESVIGLGDITLAARYNLYRRPMGVISTETRAKLPGGYRAPGQTFRDPTNASPNAQEDDVTLGDGQTDLEQSILFGGYVPATRTFARAGLGVRLRFGAPGHQAIGDAKVGQFIGKSLVVFGGVRGAFTVIEGDTLGTTFVVTRNNVTSQNIRDSDIRRDLLSLDKDFLQTEAGLLVVLSSDAEMQVVYSYIPVGKNISAIHSVSVGMTIRIPELTADKP